MMVMAVRLWIRLFLWRVSEGGVRRLLPVTLQRTGVRVLSINAGATFLDPGEQLGFSIGMHLFVFDCLRTIYGSHRFLLLIVVHRDRLILRSRYSGKDNVFVIPYAQL
jgi:hypothetical protein